MNSVFDFNRWLLYVSKHWHENKRKYLLSLGAIGGLMILWYSFLMIVNPKHALADNMQLITYFVGLFLTGCLYASLVFSELSEGPKAMHYLLAPASLLEKLLSAILYGVILFFISYTVVFYAVDFIMVKVGNGVAQAVMEREHRPFNHPTEVINVFMAKDRNGVNLNFYLLLIYFGIQSIFLLGSIYFEKYQYIKTLVSGLIVFLVLVFFMHKVLGSFMPDGGFFKPFTVYRIFDHQKGELSVQLPEWFSMIMLFLIKYALAPCLWVVAYFRLKEKEV
jgi:hypothetical protein